jgi:hypothetical protein
MAIKSHDDLGFVVSVKLPDGNRWEHPVSYASLSNAMSAWAVRNGFSQAFTDCIAGTKETAAAVKKLNAKAAAFDADEVPTERVGGRSFANRLAAETFSLTVEVLRKLGLKKAEAEDMVDAGTAVAFIAKRANAAEDVVMAQIVTKAQRRVDDADILGSLTA